MASENLKEQVDEQLAAAYTLLKRLPHWSSEGRRREVAQALPFLLPPYIAEDLNHYKPRDYENSLARFRYLRAAALFVKGNEREARRLFDKIPTYNCPEQQLCESLFG